MVYYVGFGSNLGRRAKNLARARRLLEEGGAEVTAASSIYETEPVDLTGQPWFLNQVLEIRTELESAENRNTNHNPAIKKTIKKR